jgi:hypothetical protein
MRGKKEEVFSMKKIDQKEEGWKEEREGYLPVFGVSNYVLVHLTNVASIAMAVNYPNR